MSTRATYQFRTLRLGAGPLTVYIHHDGYPAGAAEYFRNALEVKQNSGRALAESFIAANEGALVTRDHQSHGDTDYRYTENWGEVTVEKRTLKFTGDHYDETWDVISKTSLEDFILKHTVEQEEEE